MVNKVLAAFVVADGLFVITGAIMLGFSVIVQQTCFNTPTEGEQAARDLLYRKFPFTVAIANAVFTFIVFLLTLPALATNSRGWLKAAGYLVVVNALFTMGIGLELWIFTLKMREQFSGIWNEQTADVQGLMETAFQCCGYFNSTSPAFVTNPTCPSPASAAVMRGCASPLVSFANTFVDTLFTAVFGMAGVDTVLLICIACLLKDRKERERYRHIDEKRGYRDAAF